jgi:hypothetical protein
MTTAASPSLRAAMCPMSKTVSPAASKAARTLAALSGLTTTAMPTPQLKVRTISSGATPPAAASQRNTGGTGQVMPSRTTPRPAGMTRGRFSRKPPPVMCAKALIPPVSSAARQLFT